MLTFSRLTFSRFCRFDSLQNKLQFKSILNTNKLINNRLIIKSGVSSVSGFCVGYFLWSRCKTLRCDSQHIHDDVSQETQESVYENVQKICLNEKFDFNKVWDLLKPDALYLIVAVSVSDSIVIFTFY